LSAVIFVDFRAAARILLTESGTRAPIDRAIATTTSLLSIDLLRMIERRRAAGLLAEPSFGAKKRESERLVASMYVMPLGDEVLELAREDYPFAVSTVDSLYVATAQLVARESPDLELWTHDPAVASAAIHRGLRVKGVENLTTG
jgi:hypothetical protein